MCATAARIAIAAMLVLAGVPGVVRQAVAQQSDVQKRFAHLPEAQRDLLIKREAALRAMTPALREAFRQRVDQWHALRDTERQQRRERWRAWQALPAHERARLQAAANAFAALPVEQQLALRERYAQLDLSQHRGWLLGPEIGNDFDRLQPLLLQLPAAQRDPMLSALRAMTPEQRHDLGVLAQRTPPQERDRLRSELLAQPSHSRGAWLIERLDR